MKLPDSDRSILAEQELDTREIGRHDDPPTDDELAEGYDDLETLWEAVMDAAFPDDDIRDPH